MSSSPTAPSSTTASSTSLLSRSEPATSLVIACGAIAAPIAEIVTARGWPVDVRPLPPLLHNSPALIAAAVESTARPLADRYDRVVIGYADCGTYGALDAVCSRYGWTRLPGLHCYDVFGGAERLERIFADQPGTYVLTDFLVRSFRRSVLVELGIDRHPELRDAYFGHYTQVVWLAQRPDDELRALARAAAEQLGLPLTEIATGATGLERALAAALDRLQIAPEGPALSADE